MDYQDAVMDEKFPHKVTVEYESRTAADQAAGTLSNEVGLEPEQIRMVPPHGDNVAEAVEPEPRGMANTIIKSHIRLGAVGLIVGLVAAGLLITIGPVATQSSPLLTMIALGFVGMALGLLLAGALALRPDHERVAHKTRAAAEAGKWTLVAHCADTEQRDRVKQHVGHSAQTL